MRIWQTYISVCVLFVAVSGCDPHPGFSKEDSGVYMRLNGFRDCQPVLAQADFCILDVDIHKVYENKTDSGTRLQIAVHDLFMDSIASFSQELKKLNCGDYVSYIIPYGEMVRTLPLQGNFSDKDKIQVNIIVQHTFDSLAYKRYITGAASRNEMEETASIALFLDQFHIPAEPMGELFIETLEQGYGDTIKSGSDIEIHLVTALLDETLLGDTIDMKFTYGKPGQVVSGLQYALSGMLQGEKANIYIPSSLAFGTDGNSNGLVPPQTPVRMGVEVMSVKNKTKK